MWSHAHVMWLNRCKTRVRSAFSRSKAEVNRLRTGSAPRDRETHSTDLSDSTMSIRRSLGAMARFTITANSSVSAAEYT